MAVTHLTKDNFDSVTSEGLVLIDFWATWCGPCKMMSPIVEKLADEYDGKALIGKVESDNAMALMQRFGISAIPTLIFFKNGAEIARKVGVMPESALREVLDANL